MERKKRVVPREVCMARSERSNHCTRKRGSAEHTEVSRGHSRTKGRRTESVGVFSTTGKGGKSRWTQKTKKAAYKRIVRNTKDMWERVALSIRYGRKGTVHSMAANSCKAYWFTSNTTTVKRALSKQRLINSGFYDLATAYQSVHINYWKRRVPNGTHGAVRGRELVTPSYSILRINTISTGGFDGENHTDGWTSFPICLQRMYSGIWDQRNMGALSAKGLFFRSSNGGYFYFFGSIILVIWSAQVWKCKQ